MIEPIVYKPRIHLQSKPCKNCECELRYISTGHCVNCAKHPELRKKRVPKVESSSQARARIIQRLRDDDLWRNYFLTKPWGSHVAVEVNYYGAGVR